MDDDFIINGAKFIRENTTLYWLKVNKEAAFNLDKYSYVSNRRNLACFQAGLRNLFIQFESFGIVIDIRKWLIIFTQCAGIVLIEDKNLGRVSEEFVGGYVTTF